MTTSQQIEQAIKAYKEISEGSVKGIKLQKQKYIKVGSVTFIV